MADDIKLPELPEPDATYGHDFWIAGSMMAYARAAVEAERARHVTEDMRAAVPQAPAVPDGYKLLEDGKTMIPSDWTWCRMEWEPNCPEDVAFGPARMMKRLKKWLDRYYAGMQAADGWEAPDASKTWQGGLTNEELEQWWRLKLPNVEATNRDIGVFALGVEVGCGRRPAPKPDDVLAEIAAPGAAQPAPQVPLTDEQRRDVLAAAAYVEGADVDASVLSCADATRIVRVLREIAGEAAHGIPAPKGGSES